MRLLTHNMLKCNVRKCQHYPLALHVDAYVTVDAELNADFLHHMFPKLDWAVLRATCRTLQWPVPAVPDAYQTDTDRLPDEVPYGPDSEPWLHALHEVLMARNITSGNMTCAACGHLFPIRDGIPNMLLKEDEV